MSSDDVQAANDPGRERPGAANFFRTLCEWLGYEADEVLSVRANARAVVVVFVDRQGQLATASYEQDDGRLRPAPTGWVAPGAEDLRGSREPTFPAGRLNAEPLLHRALA